MRDRHHERCSTHDPRHNWPSPKGNRFVICIQRLCECCLCKRQLWTWVTSLHAYLEPVTSLIVSNPTWTGWISVAECPKGRLQRMVCGIFNVARFLVSLQSIPHPSSLHESS